MSGRVEEAVAVLDKLVAFPTVTTESNLDLIGYVADYLRRRGVETMLSYDATGTKANLFATIGPPVDGGVVLSGHTDVVPVEGQIWDTDPFSLVRRDGRLYARGAVDMKGFIACALASVPAFLAAGLARPLHLAFTFDEEIGSCGAPVLVDQIKTCPYRPRVAIVGEPTGMSLISGHKGGYELTTTVIGLEGHASNPGKGVNAIDYALRFIAHLREVAGRLAADPDPGTPFDPPHSTISVGTIQGGTARNVIAGYCRFDWELRPVPQDDAMTILQSIDDFARQTLVPEMRATHPVADVVTELVAAYPGLKYEAESEAIDLVRRLTGINASDVVSFGSDAGHFQNAGMATVVFGPGSIDQAHKPNEYIAVDDLADCLGFLDRLRDWLARGG